MSEPAQEQALPIPFHTQHWDLENWHEQGFSSRDDAEYWQRSSCGILCLQMAMEFLLKHAISFQEILQTGLRLKAYSDDHGWSHQGLCTIAKEYRLNAEAKNCTAEMLGQAIDQHAVPMVSIKWALQNEKSWKERILFWKRYGGHLAVVVGYRREGSSISHVILHHTSKIKEQNWVARPIPVKQFLAGYTGRAIIIHPNQL